MDLKYKKDYIVEETSAAPMMVAGVERAGIMADHSGMCKFDNDKEQGFRIVVAALRRYVAEAPEVIKERRIRAGEAERKRRWEDAHDLVQHLVGQDLQISHAF